MAGGPSQIETFDDKPVLRARNGESLPDSVRQGQRLTGMSGNQSTLPLAGSQFGFSQHGRSGTWVSDLLPHTARVVDDLCIVRSMHTDAINHDPAITFFQTGSQIAGRPSMGAWVHYGLGTDTQDLPAFVVLITPGKVDQPLYSRLWGSGFLPSRHQGVQFRSGKDPVLYLTNPAGVTPQGRRLLLDRLRDLHAYAAEQLGDGEVDARIAQYEMSYRMQASVPGVMDVSGETEETLDLYGPDAKTPGSFAANCLLARRLAERGVKFIQLYHQGWDQHDSLPKGIERQCRETDQASAALVTDLKRRGLLDDTLVVWGGEFGRTSYSQGKLTATNYGRDHHPRCFSIWMAGAGVKAGLRPRRHRRLRLQHRRRWRPRARLPRHAAAPARRRPRTPDVPAPGPPLPAHRRQRQGRRRAAGVAAIRAARGAAPTLTRVGRVPGNAPETADRYRCRPAPTVPPATTC